jgi:hypothetical protein
LLLKQKLLPTDRNNPTDKAKRKTEKPQKVMWAIGFWFFCFLFPVCFISAGLFLSVGGILL